MYRQSGKGLLSSNISPTCPHNMVNFGPLAAEILSLVWGTPGNFNGFAALLHGTLVVGVSQTAALNRGRPGVSAGRPSIWALAHISSYYSSASQYYTDAAYCYRLSSVVCLSVCWPVCHNRELCEKWLSRSRCCLNCGLGWPQRSKH